jgi:hypothetical protein
MANTQLVCRPFFNVAAAGGKWHWLNARDRLTRATGRKRTEVDGVIVTGEAQSRRQGNTAKKGGKSFHH